MSFIIVDDVLNDEYLPVTNSFLQGVEGSVGFLITRSPELYDNFISIPFRGEDLLGKWLYIIYRDNEWRYEISDEEEEKCDEYGFTDCIASGQISGDYWEALIENNSA